MKNLGEHRDLYFQSNILLLANVFENFRKMYLEIYELDPAKSLSAPGLAQQAVLKKTKVKLIFLTDIHMLLMVEKGIREEICHSIYRYAKANNKDMKDHDKNKESSYIQYQDVNSLYVWVMPERLSVNNFESIKNAFQFNKNFIKIYNKESDEGYFF